MNSFDPGGMSHSLNEQLAVPAIATANWAAPFNLSWHADSRPSIWHPARGLERPYSWQQKAVSQSAIVLPNFSHNLGSTVCTAQGLVFADLLEQCLNFVLVDAVC